MKVDDHLNPCVLYFLRLQQKNLLSYLTDCIKFFTPKKSTY